LVGEKLHAVGAHYGVTTYTDYDRFLEHDMDAVILANYFHEHAPFAIKARVQEVTGHEFNSVLLNLYRDGRDGMGWHADDEPELGREPVIASLSLGCARLFKLRHRRHRNQVCTIALQHGDLLLMAGGTQHNYVHAVPKTARPMGERINLTLRRVRPPAGT